MNPIDKYHILDLSCKIPMFYMRYIYIFLNFLILIFFLFFQYLFAHM